MHWRRLIIYGVPLALMVLIVGAFRGARRLEASAIPPGGIVLAVTEMPDGLNPFVEGNAAAELVKSHLYNRLLRPGDDAELVPELAVSWQLTEVARFFFLSEKHAEVALVTLRKKRDRWDEWGLLEVRVRRDELRVRFAEPGIAGPEGVYGLLDPEALVPAVVLRVQTLQSAWDSWLDFKSHAVEAAQIRRERLLDESRFEIVVAGKTEDFVREFTAYYESNRNLGAGYRFEDERPFLEELELLINLRSDVAWHDGEPFTAEDVIFSYAVARDQPWDDRVRKALSEVESVSAIDEHTVLMVYRRVSLEPIEDWVLIPMLPRHRLQASSPSRRSEAYDTGVVGTGPLRLGVTFRDDTVELLRNESYFLGAPDTPRFEMVRLPGRVERRLSLVGGVVDSCETGRGEGDLAGRDARFELVPAGAAAQTMLIWNASHPDAIKREERRALSELLSLDALVAEVCPTSGRPGGALFTEASEFHRADAWELKGDAVTALKTLAAAGWPVSGGESESDEPAPASPPRRVVLAVEPGEVPGAAAAHLARVWREAGVDAFLMPLGERARPRADGAFPAPDAHVALVSVLPVSSWLDFSHSRLREFVTMEAGGFSDPLAPDGKRLLRRIDFASRQEEKLSLWSVLETELVDDQLMTLLFRDRTMRVIRAGEFGISQAIGDGHRVERELSAETARGADAFLPWWVRRTGGEEEREPR